MLQVLLLICSMAAPVCDEASANDVIVLPEKVAICNAIPLQAAAQLKRLDGQRIVMKCVR